MLASSIWNEQRDCGVLAEGNIQCARSGSFVVVGVLSLGVSCDKGPLGMVESHLHMLSETKEVGEPGACRAGAWHGGCLLIGWSGSGVPTPLHSRHRQMPHLSPGTHAGSRVAAQLACLALAPAPNVVMVTS